MKAPLTVTTNQDKVELSRLQVVCDSPEAWKVLAVWDLSLHGAAKGDKIGSQEHAERLALLTGLAVGDCQHWAGVVSRAKLAFANGEITKPARDYINAMLLATIEGLR